MIGIFDSGIGGFSIVKKIFKKIPSVPIIYFGDTAHLPYGTKSPEAIIKYSISAIKFLKERGAKIIIIACNTSSAVASDKISEIFKNYPIFDVISPAAKYILQKKYKKIGLMGTPATINSRAYQKLLLARDPSIKIYSIACPLLVPLIEEGWLKNKVMSDVLKYYLSGIKEKNPQALVLGCTHYPLIKKEIKKVMAGKNVDIINPADALISDLENFILTKNYKINSGMKNKFFVSDNPYKLKQQAKMFLNVSDVAIEKITLNSY